MLVSLSKGDQPVLRALAGHGGEHDHLGGGDDVEVVHLHLVLALLPRRVGPLLGRGQIRLRNISLKMTSMKMTSLNKWQI